MTQCIQAYNKDVSSYLSISLYIFIMYIIRMLFSIKIIGIDWKYIYHFHFNFYRNYYLEPDEKKEKVSRVTYELSWLKVPNVENLLMSDLLCLEELSTQFLGIASVCFSHIRVFTNYVLLQRVCNGHLKPLSLFERAPHFFPLSCVFEKKATSFKHGCPKYHGWCFSPSWHQKHHRRR